MAKEIDLIDRRILRALVEDASLTNNQLAEQVGLSPSPCWQRVRRLEADGYIKGYTAIIDQSRLGMPETVVVEVTLDHHDDEILDQFGKAVAEFPEVLVAFMTSGDYDCLLRVAVSSPAGYEEFLRKKLYKVPGIRHTRSIFILKCLKQELSVMPEV